MINSVVCNIGDRLIFEIRKNNHEEPYVYNSKVQEFDEHIRKHSFT
jgi:hypothetical protein